METCSVSLHFAGGEHGEERGTHSLDQQAWLRGRSLGGCLQHRLTTHQRCYMWRPHHCLREVLKPWMPVLGIHLDLASAYFTYLPFVLVGSTCSTPELFASPYAHEGCTPSGSRSGAGASWQPDTSTSQPGQLRGQQPLARARERGRCREGMCRGTGQLFSPLFTLTSVSGCSLGCWRPSHAPSRRCRLFSLTDFPAD